VKAIPLKTTWLIVGVLGIVAGTTTLFPQDRYSQDRAIIQQNIANIASAKKNFVPRDPWRAIDGATNYIKKDGVEFCGKVMDVTKDGARIEGSFGELFETTYAPRVYNYDDFFVANFPFEVVNNQVIPASQHLMAWHVGTYTYSTVNGGSRTIKKLDYGIPCEIPPELIKQQIEAAKARAIADKKRAEQGQVTAVKWLQTQATNGSGSAQCSLGIHYLNGQGCETNRELAIYWPKKAADQGDIEATNILARLPAQP
jgi:hypothetical protein